MKAKTMRMLSDFNNAQGGGAGGSGRDCQSPNGLT